MNAELQAIIQTLALRLKVGDVSFWVLILDEEGLHLGAKKCDLGSCY